MENSGDERDFGLSLFAILRLALLKRKSSSASSKSRRPVTLSAFLTERQFLAEQFTDLGRRTGSPSLADHPESNQPESQSSTSNEPNKMDMDQFWHGTRLCQGH